MLLESLCQIGFTKKEATVYLELLQLGPQAASVIAKRSKMNRTTAYSVFRSLEQKGVVSSFFSNKVRIYVANDPNTLVGYLDRQSRGFDRQKEKLISAIPDFKELAPACCFTRPVVSYYDGLAGVKLVMHDALETRGVFRGYLCINKWIEAGLEDFLFEYKNLRINEKKIKLRAILPDRSDVRDFCNMAYDVNSDMTEILYVDEEAFPHMFDNEINVYEDKIAIIRLDKGAEYGVIIQSKEIADMNKMIFDMAWKGFALQDKSRYR